MALSMSQFKEKLEDMLEVEMSNTGEGELNSGCKNEPRSKELPTEIDAVVSESKEEEIAVKPEKEKRKKEKKKKRRHITSSETGGGMLGEKSMEGGRKRRMVGLGVRI